MLHKQQEVSFISFFRVPPYPELNSSFICCYKTSACEAEEDRPTLLSLAPAGSHSVTEDKERIRLRAASNETTLWGGGDLGQSSY